MGYLRRYGLGLLATSLLAILLQSSCSPGPAAGSSKEFSLIAREVLWEISPGQTIKAWAFNGMVPGPELRVKEGDQVRVTLKNELPVATSIHWHGVDVPWQMDGVPSVNQKPVMPGETFTYEFTARPAGTRFYHTHGSGAGDEALQMDMGLYGALIIERSEEAKYDRDYTVVLSEGSSGEMSMENSAENGSEMMAMSGMFFMNGKVWPDTDPLIVKTGDKVRIRLINAGSMSTHPMHLHGHTFKIIAIDGNLLANPVERDTIPLTPGERYDIEFVADNPGVWLFHCHELHHADAGMVMMVKYDGYEAIGSTEMPSMPGRPTPHQMPGN